VIPGTDWETLIGYLINFVHQTFQIYVVIIAVFVTSFYTIFFILNVFSQYDSIEVELDNLSELAIKHEKDEQKIKIKNQRKIKEKIGKITDEHVKLFE
jgi:low affinity Fe/Cu permease